MPQNNFTNQPPDNLPTASGPTVDQPKSAKTTLARPAARATDSLIKPSIAKQAAPPIKSQPVPTSTDVTPPPQKSPSLLKQQPGSTTNNQTKNQVSSIPNAAVKNAPLSTATANVPKPDIQEQAVEILEQRSALMKIIMIILIVVGGIGLTIGGYYIYKNWLSQSVESTDQQEKEKKEAADKIKQETESQDKDSDGLLDEWEKKYGLSSDDASDASKDKDRDGLKNSEEYKYGTDPTNPDTDGDSYKDGDEVRNGYNPKGSGKLSQNNNGDSTNKKFTYVAGDWRGTLQGKQYIFQDVVMTLRSDGKILSYFTLIYRDIDIQNEASGNCDFIKETLALSCRMDVNGESESGKATYLLGFSGQVNESYDEASGSWYIIASDYTAPWVTQDKGTFNLRKYST